MSQNSELEKKEPHLPLFILFMDEFVESVKPLLVYITGVAFILIGTFMTMQTDRALNLTNIGVGVLMGSGFAGKWDGLKSKNK